MHTRSRSLQQSPQIYYWATSAIAFSFFTLGLTTSALPSILADIQKQATSSRLQVIFLYLSLTLGQSTGTLIATFTVEAIPTATFLFNGVALLILGVCFASLPFIEVDWNFFFIFFAIGFSSGWIDISGNSMVLKFFGKRSAKYCQITHLCFGIGAILGSVVVYFVRHTFDKYNWSAWGITIIACLSTVASLSNIFIDIPSTKKNPKHTKFLKVLNQAARVTAVGSNGSAGGATMDGGLGGSRIGNRSWHSSGTLSWISSSKDDRTPLLPKNDGTRIVTKHGYMLAVSSTARTVIISFTSAFLFIFAGLHGSLSFWLCEWISAYVTPDEFSYFMLAGYWLGFTVSSLFLERIKIQWAVSNFFILFGDILGGTLVTGLLALTVQSGKAIPRDQVIWLWACIPMIGIFNAGIFPAAVSIPNDNSLWVRKRDKHWLTLGYTLGNLGVPLVVGFLFYWDMMMGIIWMTFALYLLSIILFLSTLLFCIFSRDLAELSQLSHVDSTVVIVPVVAQATAASVAVV